MTVDQGTNIAAGSPVARINIETINEKPPFADLAADVRRGLFDPAPGVQRYLAPKYFYDERGSHLFDQICDTPEYYPTRTEDALLSAEACKILEHCHPEQILELGSGASRKTRHLFDACEYMDHYVHYQPVDICKEIIYHAGKQLTARYQWLQVDGLVADYSEDLGALPMIDGRRLYVFLGGTLGNFTEPEAQQFLGDLRKIMAPQDLLLLGVDRVKDHDILNRAYNDAGGVTAAFNKNVLKVINTRLKANFDMEQFEHHAWFDEEHSRIEMHLRSLTDQTVHFGKLKREVVFAAEETILTEISRKYTPQTLDALLNRAGLAPVEHFEPENAWFSLVVAAPIVTS